jgi:hypothetical protein
MPRRIAVVVSRASEASCKAFRSKEGGATFVEVLIAIVLLGFIAAGVAPALGYNVRASYEVKESTTAECLTRNQVEYLKSCLYIAGNETHPYPSYTVVPVPDGTYQVSVAAQPIRIVPDTLAHVPLAPGEDEGIQEIAIEVRHVDRVVLATRLYKTDR